MSGQVFWYQHLKRYIFLVWNGREGSSWRERREVSRELPPLSFAKWEWGIYYSASAAYFSQDDIAQRASEHDLEIIACTDTAYLCLQRTWEAEIMGVSAEAFYSMLHITKGQASVPWKSCTKSVPWNQCPVMKHDSALLLFGKHCSFLCNKHSKNQPLSESQLHKTHEKMCRQGISTER